MFKAGLVLLTGLSGMSAWADFVTGDALVIGNARYGALQGAFGPEEVGQVAKALSLRGQEVVSLANGGHLPMQQALASFADTIAEGEAPLVVVLSGRFAVGGSGPVLRPAGRAAAMQEGLALGDVLAVLAQSPRRAFLVLGADEGAAALDGIDIPEGVTVIRGPSESIARFAAREMAQPGQRLRRTASAHGLSLAGYVTEGLTVLDHTEVRPPTQAEQAAARDRALTADNAAWRAAAKAATAEAMLAYLDSYPEGAHVAEATKGIAVAALKAAESDLALNLGARKTVQRQLVALGFDTRGIDGIFGPGTRAALAAWQKQVGAQPTGFLDAAQVAQLSEAAAKLPARPAPARPVAVRATVPAGEAATWRMARGEQGLRNYLGQYPNGTYARRARVLLSNLQRGSGQ
ncbi:peptidoglycan-binding protein [Mameliella sediminis]|uniref:peptidoglycan-binding protein n=1 Tax=Mameliella sediminis TaxID=2836866 RepID=UPI001FED2076|nr:peptidoglycan-binding protein [Mameliella sediminis]